MVIGHDGFAYTEDTEHRKTMVKHFGGVEIGDDVLLGENGYIAGNIIRNQCTIGKNAFVGLGAVVVKDVPKGVTVVGNPARPFRKK